MTVSPILTSRVDEDVFNIYQANKKKIDLRSIIEQGIRLSAADFEEKIDLLVVDTQKKERERKVLLDQIAMLDKEINKNRKQMDDLDNNNKKLADCRNSPIFLKNLQRIKNRSTYFKNNGIFGVSDINDLIQATKQSINIELSKEQVLILLEENDGHKIEVKT